MFSVISNLELILLLGVVSNFPFERYYVTRLELNYVFNSNDWFIEFGG